MFLRDKLLRQQVSYIIFEEGGDPLSSEITALYNQLRISYRKSLDGIIRCRHKKRAAPRILRYVLEFYHRGETLLMLVLNEIFNKNFMEVICRRWNIFKLLDNIMKMFLSIDCAKLRYPEIFCHYSFYKIFHRKKFLKDYDPYLDQQLCVISMIVLPFGRLVLSLFSTERLEMYYPSLLGKRLGISLTPDKSKLLYIHCVITDKYKLKYASLYLTTVHYKFYGVGSYKRENAVPDLLKTYSEMLLEHL